MKIAVLFLQFVFILPLPDKAVYQLYDGLKAYRSLVGETPLWRRCVEDVKKMASLSNNETVIVYSMLL